MRARGLRVGVTVGIVVLLLAGGGILASVLNSGSLSPEVLSGSAPEPGSAARLAPDLLRALESDDVRSVVALAPGSSRSDIGTIMSRCADERGTGVRPNLSEVDGPQAVLVVADGQPPYTVPRTGSCGWWMYWDQRHRSWTVGPVVGSPQPDAPAGP